ncbi:flagellar hook-length control protein FliK [Paracoccus sp. (in: a-proteobacteria)]|uniref:flagellar hook-length control protein FliK n=1 Tax=Paracoccus sp. TaxID=267 RepID=UPI0026DF4456|nr:flagellar hook-length control protein FliK [Paracoccus sp. (in: a-proteobacteria)]MDO5647425.1 flagellar hook-length control protein FliK [Paracoccus sp. (in: a-proteobacteria)]
MDISAFVIKDTAAAPDLRSVDAVKDGAATGLFNVFLTLPSWDDAETPAAPVAGPKVGDDPLSDWLGAQSGLCAMLPQAVDHGVLSNANQRGADPDSALFDDPRVADAPPDRTGSMATDTPPMIRDRADLDNALAASDGRIIWPRPTGDQTGATPTAAPRPLVPETGPRDSAQAADMAVMPPQDDQQAPAAEHSPAPTLRVAGGPVWAALPEPGTIPPEGRMMPTSPDQPMAPVTALKAEPQTTRGAAAPIWDTMPEADTPLPEGRMMPTNPDHPPAPVTTPATEHQTPRAASWPIWVATSEPVATPPEGRAMPASPSHQPAPVTAPKAEPQTTRGAAAPIWDALPEADTPLPEGRMTPTNPEHPPAPVTTPKAELSPAPALRMVAAPIGAAPDIAPPEARPMHTSLDQTASVTATRIIDTPAPFDRGAALPVADTGLDTPIMPDLRWTATAPLHPVAAPQTTAPSTTSVPPAIQQVATAILSQDDNTIDITLAPAELGRVRVQIVQDAATPHVVVTAERAEALDLMRRHADLLQKMLNDSGLNLADLSFQQGRSGDSPRRSAQASRLDQPTDRIDTAPASRPAASDKRIDIRL